MPCGTVLTGRLPRLRAIRGMPAERSRLSADDGRWHDGSGTGTASAARRQGDVTMTDVLYGAARTRRVTVADLRSAKERRERWPMITCYDAMTARVFEDAGIPVLLVGDSAS